MHTMPSRPRIVRFGVFEVDFQAAELRKSGVRQKLAGQPFQVLQLLLEHPREAVTREELRRRIWPENTFVDYDLALKKAVNRVRLVLGDSAESPRFIETIPRHGYRFLAPVETVEKPDSAPSKNLRKRWLLGSGLALAGIAGILFGFNVSRFRDRVWGSPQVRSIVVLPLENLSHDPEQEYFANGITDAVTTNLAQITALRVISRTSAMHFQGAKATLPEIGRQLQVDAVVEGTVMREQNRVRITAQLIEARTDRHLWARSYERDLRDVLTLQDELARDIAGQIRVTLTPHERARLASARPIDPEIYSLYLKGRYFWNKRTQEGFSKALGYFAQAVEKDADYGPAYAGLADTYALLGGAGYDVLPTSEAMAKAKSAALTALRIDDTLAEAHASLAFVKFSHDWDWVAAETEFKRAIELNPNYATAHQWYSEYLSNLGRRDEAEAEARTAAALDPLSLIVVENLARPDYFARRFEQAMEKSRRTLEMDPGFAIAHLRLGRELAADGKYAAAVAEFQKFSSLSGNNVLALASVANARARSGDRNEALRLLDQLSRISKRKHVPALDFALVYAGLDDKDQAFVWLEKACQERSDFLVTLKVDTLFDPLRTDPRFQDVLRRVGLGR